MNEDTYYLVEGKPKDKYIYYHFIFRGNRKWTKRFTQSHWNAYFKENILKGIGNNNV